ncbi:MAG: hypothetical protein MI784_00230 [Cytophagales bacterium]|nr:hypothetical protein [Cytophagales bacterium]
MKKDIEKKEVTGVRVAIAKTRNPEGEWVWDAYLINCNSYDLENVIVASKGYTIRGGKEMETSTLRHMFKELKAGAYAKIEPVNPEVFSLTNEYWVSFFCEEGFLDKRFIFPEEICQDRFLVDISEIGLRGVYSMN